MTTITSGELTCFLNAYVCPFHVRTPCETSRLSSKLHLRRGWLILWEYYIFMPNNMPNRMTFWTICSNFYFFLYHRCVGDFVNFDTFCGLLSLNEERCINPLFHCLKRLGPDVVKGVVWSTSWHSHWRWKQQHCRLWCSKSGQTKMYCSWHLHRPKTYATIVNHMFQ